MRLVILKQMRMHDLAVMEVAEDGVGFFGWERPAGDESLGRAEVVNCSRSERTAGICIQTRSKLPRGATPVGHTTHLRPACTRTHKHTHYA